MARLLEYLETDEVNGELKYKCTRCGFILGFAREDYKNFVAKRSVPISRAQPAYLADYAAKSDTFVIREYYCPECGVMFEVDMVRKDEPQIRSIELKI